MGGWAGGQVSGWVGGQEGEEALLCGRIPCGEWWKIIVQYHSKELFSKNHLLVINVKEELAEEQDASMVPRVSRSLLIN